MVARFRAEARREAAFSRMANKKTASAHRGLRNNHLLMVEGDISIHLYLHSTIDIDLGIYDYLNSTLGYNAEFNTRTIR